MEFCHAQNGTRAQKGFGAKPIMLLMKQSRGVRALILSFEARKKLGAAAKTMPPKSPDRMASASSTAKVMPDAARVRPDAGKPGPEWENIDEPVIDQGVDVDKDEVMTVATLIGAMPGEMPSEKALLAKPTSTRTPHEGRDQLELGGIVQDIVASAGQTIPACEQPLRSLDQVAAAKILRRFRSLGTSFGDA